MEKAYDPVQFEDKIYQEWESKGYFKADDKSDKPSFTIPMPPPNVTGALHNGHALFVTLEDTLIRWKRMSGYNALWLPGTDHAGIATQMVVERELAKNKTSRHELGREEFIKRVWSWKDTHGEIIVNQMRKLGASPDWDRARFTMDPGLSKAVRLVFEKLYNEGLVYRGTRVTNRCLRCETVLSDLEVVPTERKSHLWHIQYPLADGSGSVTIATTRPETLLGDTAVAVHPEDERYKALIGKKVVLPLLNREIPIIADTYVDREFGTGTLKVTPAHDFNDYELGKRHNLPVISIMDQKGILNSNAGPYCGLRVTVARDQVIRDLQEKNLLTKTEELVQQVGLCQRCESIVEPMMSEQWFMNMKPLAEKAVAAAKKGESMSLTEVDRHDDAFKILPDTWYSTYYHWMDNIRDWCVSRQLWWGHRIPAWYCKDCSKVTVSSNDVTSCQHCHSTSVHQDEDVLDTWFSSGLWPFATLGWPEKTEAYNRFYPSSILETGFDILFFWVARMLMMGIHFNEGRVPFKRVYLHAMVRDEKGQKMSKTKGNVIDPLDIIREYGADAFRFTLLSMAGQGRDIKLSTDRIENDKAFCNKLWNASRYVLMKLGYVAFESNAPGFTNPEPFQELATTEWLTKNYSTLHPVNQWILSRLEKTADSINVMLDEFRVGEASQQLYDFSWRDFCDWYIEFSKELLTNPAYTHQTQVCLLHVLRSTLALAHPFIPFITEQIYKNLPKLPGDSQPLMQHPFPRRRIDGVCQDQFTAANPAAEETVMFWKQIVERLRAFRGENRIAPKARPAVTFQITTAAEPGFALGIPMIISLAQIGSLTPEKGNPAERFDTSELNCGPVKLFISLQGLIDVDGEIKRLEKEKAKIADDIGHSERKLAKKEFLDRAPQSLINEEQGKVNQLKLNLQSVDQSILRLNKMRG